VTGDNVRASDLERQAVVDRLAAACGDGLLTLEEFSDRAGEAYAAVTRSELDDVVRDLRLPATVGDRLQPGRAAPGTAEPSRRSWIVALFGSNRRRGRWRAEPRIRTVAIMGSAQVDLRNALIEGHDVEILAGALMGAVHVVVPAGIPVDVRGFTLMGSRHNDVAPTNTFDVGPRVLVRGYGLFGAVSVDSSGSHIDRVSSDLT